MEHEERSFQIDEVLRQEVISNHAAVSRKFSSGQKITIMAKDIMI